MQAWCCAGFSVLTGLPPAPAPPPRSLMCKVSKERNRQVSATAAMKTYRLSWGCLGELPCGG